MLTLCSMNSVFFLSCWHNFINNNMEIQWSLWDLRSPQTVSPKNFPSHLLFLLPFITVSLPFSSLSLPFSFPSAPWVLRYIPLQTPSSSMSLSDFSLPTPAPQLPAPIISLKKLRNPQKQLFEAEWNKRKKRLLRNTLDILSIPMSFGNIQTAAWYSLSLLPKT